MLYKKIHMPHWPQPRWKELDGSPVERTKILLNRLGNPEKKLPPVIHVAGTNGKGSTIAFLRAILQAAGYKVHSYTSPHLIKFNERIVMNNEQIDDEKLEDIIERVRIVAGDMEVNFFEGATAAAFLAFSENEADILLVETGLGGTFDPTNVIESKLLTIITTVSSDHTRVLGNTLAEIATHKAGIMRKNTPCVISYQPKEAKDILLKEAEIIGAIPFVFGKNWIVRKIGDSMIYEDNNGKVELPMPSLMGDHQIINAGNSIAAVTLLENLEISGENIAEGLQTAKWLGRMEKIVSGNIAALLPSEWELWFDGGHNIAAGYAISEIIRQWKDKPLYLICGSTAGKDVAGFLTPFAGMVKALCGVSVKSEYNSYKADEICKASEFAGIKAVVCEDVESAVSYIIADEIEPSRILLFGSLFLRIELES